MDAIGFLYPNVLWAWFLLLIPILIHLFNFRKYKTVYFTNVSLLKSIKQETKSKSQLRQILILLMRLLFVFFLVLAFAQPYIQKNTDKSAKSGQLVILIDNSFSMSSVGESGVQLEYAKRKALDLLEACPQSTKVMLVSTDVDKSQLYFKSKNELISDVAKLKVSAFAQSIDKVLKIIENRLMTISSDASVYVISDFQKKDFSLGEKDSLSLKMIYLPTVSADNISIDTAYFLSPIHTVFSDETMVYAVRNNSSKDRVNFSVSLKINDTLKSISNVDLPAGDLVYDTIRFVNTSGGFQAGALQIQDLPIIFDNDLYFSYLNINRLASVLISDENNAYLKALFVDNSFFDTRSFSENNIDYVALEQANLLVFVEQPNTSKNTVQLIAERLKAGANMIHFACEESALLKELGIEQLSSDTAYSTITDINLQSELFRDAVEKHQNRYDLPKIKTGFVFKKDLSSILSDNKEQAFVSYQKQGRGRLLTFSVPLSMDNYNFYTHPAIIPLIYNFSAKQNESDLYYETDKGGLLFLKNYPMRKPVVEIQSGAMRMIPEQYPSGNFLKMILPERLQSGHYQIDADSLVGAFSVNNSRKESVQSFYSKEELTDAGYHVIEAQSVHSENLSDIIQDSKPLWYHCLMMSILFLLLEMVFLVWFRQ